MTSKLTWPTYPGRQAQGPALLLQGFLQEPQRLRAHAVQPAQLGGGHAVQLVSRVYPAAVSARVAGAPMFAGRPASGVAMGGS